MARFSHLTQELLQESLETLEGSHRELILRTEARIREVERLADLNGEDGENSPRTTLGGTPSEPTSLFRPPPSWPENTVSQAIPDAASTRDTRKKPASFRGSIPQAEV